MDPTDIPQMDRPPDEAAAETELSQATRTERPIVVGMGASAGGIEALQTFFEALPEDLGVVFVVILHLSPEHRSYLAEVLARSTALPVEQVQNRAPFRENHIFVIPPDRQLRVSGNMIEAVSFKEPRGRRMPIDAFFHSLAEEHGDGFAIILSGGGSDGAMGVKAIKEQGGLILVQDPAEAGYDSMPQAAIATGVADVVAPVAELALRLAELVKTKRRIGQTFKTQPVVLDSDQEQTLLRILSHLHSRTGHDFSKYKRATVLRRLSRRMQIQRKDTLNSYLAFFRQNVEEVKSLFADLLISVTTFFRDPAAFEALQYEVIPRLFEQADGNRQIRVWTPGCATGEEAYTIAMLLLEEAGRREVWPDLQIFASDLDEGALSVGREGRYPAAIESDVSPDRLRRFFVREGDLYRVTQEVRDCVLFATHSLLKDPPFSRLDLISCRNLLIYLDRDLQKQIFNLFHYALRQNGYLFLGASESAPDAFFRSLDKKYHLYQARELTSAGLPPPDLFLTTPRRRLPTEHKRNRPEISPGRALHQKLLEELAPPSIVVDENRNVIHLSETAGRFLQPRGGPLTSNIIELVRPELQDELRSALYQALERDQASFSSFIPVQFNGTPQAVALLVRPRSGETSDERLALVVFLEGGAPMPVSVLPSGEEASSESVRLLHEELHQSQMRISSMREEYGAANEDLRVANEELQSLNEEYRVAAEELETSKEEFQSLNEELETVNTELKHKLKEISMAHNDLENLMAATDIGTLFLNLDLHIHRFTPRLADLFNVTPADRGRPIGDFTHHLDYDRLEADARQVLEKLMHQEREVRSRDERWYLVRFRPYRTIENKIAGVVITFVDITERKQAEQEIRTARAYAESIVQTIHEPLVVLSSDLRVRSANSAFYKQFQTHPEQTEGRLIYELGNHHWDIPELRTLLEAVLPENNVFINYEVSHTFENIGQRVMLLNGRRLDHVQLILLLIQDITERRQAETELRQMAARLAVAEQAERRRISQVLHDELQQLLYGVQLRVGYIRQSIEAGTSEPLLTHAQQAIDWIDESLALLTRLNMDLNPPLLPGQAFNLILVWLAAQMQERYALQVKIEAERDFPVANENMSILLFQVVRELLFNIVKHGETREATVALREANERLVIEVSDGGRGFGVKAVEGGGHGSGLRRIRERLDLFGGRLEINSQPGQGTRITVYTPLNLTPE